MHLRVYFMMKSFSCYILAYLVQVHHGPGFPPVPLPAAVGTGGEILTLENVRALGTAAGHFATTVTDTLPKVSTTELPKPLGGFSFTT